MRFDEVRLGDLISIKHGYAFSGDYISTDDNGIVLVTPGNFCIGGGFQEKKCKFFTSSYPQQYVLKENDLIVTMTDLSKNGDTLGYGAKIPRSKRIYLHNQRIGLVEVKNKAVDVEYLYWFFRTCNYHNQVLATSTGSTVKHTSPDRICSIGIGLPNLVVQGKIAGLMNCIERKIELNKAINNNLQQQAFALFDELFPSISDGDKQIGDYISPKRGKNLLSKDAIQGNVPVVAGGLDAATYHNAANTIAPVLTISASGANAGFVNLWHTPVWSSDSSFIDSAMTSNVFFWFVLLKKRQKEIFDSQTGSAQPHIYPQHITAMRIPALNTCLVEKYVDQVKPLFALIGANRLENVRLSTLRGTLLPRLMSGEIDVSDVEI